VGHDAHQQKILETSQEEDVEKEFFEEVD